MSGQRNSLPTLYIGQGSRGKMRKLKESPRKRQGRSLLLCACIGRCSRLSFRLAWPSPTTATGSMSRARGWSRTSPAELTRLAHRYGYFDQPHFVKAFKRYYGLAPSQVLADRLGKGDNG